MDAVDPRRVVNEWVDAWNAHDPAGVRALTAEGFVRHDANQPDLVGPAAEEQFVAAAVAAFPDLFSSRSNAFWWTGTWSLST